jgi:hypothetical protein
MRRDARANEAIRLAGTEAIEAEGALRKRLSFVPVRSSDGRHAFDKACERLHYAGSCHRVGRKMLLAVIKDGEWIGGIILGSPFPNLRPRDDAFGLTKHVSDWRARGLTSPWARENRAYWDRLQLVVNQARAFVFPQFRGTGVGVLAHSLLETEGRTLWEAEYGRLAGFDTLCTEPNSRLFADNGWRLVGRTLGYTRDPETSLSQRVTTWKIDGVSDNAGLALTSTSTRWWIWVRVMRRIR